MRQQYLDLLRHFLSIKSVSTQEEYLEEMENARHFLKDLFVDLGFSVHILEGIKHSAVFAQKITDSKLPTVLIYGHYDVQPPDPIDQWKTPPFEPTVRDNKIYARGATDDKGQIMVHLMAAKTLVEEYGDKLPINLKFIVEGEEEIGSISVEGLVKKYGKDLFRSDYILVSDTEMPKKGQPSIDISLRGMIYTEVTIETARQDLHSGQFGGVAENPAIILASIISQLKHPNGHITVPKFYDDVVSPSARELREFSALKITKEQLKEEGNLFTISKGENWYTLNERRWARPTLDVNGIVSGYTGTGSKTIIPAKASAKISMRLAPNQDPQKIYKLFAKYVKQLVPPGVKVEVINHASALPYRAPTDHPIFNLVKQSLKKVFEKEAVFTGVGGSIGFVPVMAGALKVPCLLIGFGLNDENLHSPNEHFDLDNYYQGIEAMIDFYTKIGTKSF